MAFATEPTASKGIRIFNALHLPTSDEHRRSGRRDRTLLEAVGTTENMKGERCSTRCQSDRQALNVQSGDKKYIDGACVLADADGDKSFRLLARAISISRGQI